MGLERPLGLRLELVRQMVLTLLVLDLVKKGLVTKKIELTVSYDRTSVTLSHRGRAAKENRYKYSSTGRPYHGTVSFDYYGRPAPKHAHGTGNLDRWTSSTRRIVLCMMELYDRIVDPDLTVRRVNVTAVNLIKENEIPEDGPEQLNLFVDYDALEKQREEEHKMDAKERRMQEAALAIQRKFGKNAMLKGMNLLDGATTRQRNRQIGGHAADQPGQSSSGFGPSSDARSAGHGSRLIEHTARMTGHDTRPAEDDACIDAQYDSKDRKMK